MAFILDVAIVIFLEHKADGRLIIVAPCILGIFVGKVLELQSTLKQLDTFERSKIRLNEKIARFTEADIARESVRAEI